MKKEELFNIIGEVDEQKVAAAGMAMNTKKKSRPVWVKWGAMAACLCLAVIITLQHIPTSDDKNIPIHAPQLPGTEEYHSGKVVPAGQTNVYLNGDVVMKIAFAHAGVQATNVQNMMLTMDDTEKPFHFDLKFLALGNWHEYEIDAVTGEILTAQIQPGDMSDMPAKPIAPK